MKIIMNLNVPQRLMLGFGLLISVMLTVSTFIYINVNVLDKVKSELVDVNTPTTLAIAKIENGVNLTLAGLRGYMILGRDANSAKVMKKVRQEGWQEIDAAVSELQGLSANWNQEEAENIERLSVMKGYINEFRQAQEEVESISHTVNEIPAYKTLFETVIPQTETMLNNLSNIIQIETQLKATVERRNFINIVSDINTNLIYEVSDLRAFLLYGEIKFKEKIEQTWVKNTELINSINIKKELFNSSQLTLWNNYTNLNEQKMDNIKKIISQREGENWNMANYLLATKAAPKAVLILTLINDMKQKQFELRNIKKDALNTKSKRTKQFILMGSFIALIVGIFISITISNSITQPLKKVVNRAKQIAKGNLKEKKLECMGNDELNELTMAVNEMQLSLNSIIHLIRQSSSELSVSSETLEHSATTTSEGMEKQSAEIELVATAMSEMSATVQEVSKNASDAALSTSDADKAATEGYSLITQNLDGIKELAGSIDNASVTINKLGEDINNVDSILSVINEIAEQTNLLALNAAIEAARAGEQGRGFAVVSDEVRSLAARTQESTEEIRKMLDRLKSGSREAVNAMSKGHDQAQKNVDQAQLGAQAITKVSEAVAKINNMNIQIATAAQEQEAVAEEMNQSIVKISNESSITVDRTRQSRESAHEFSSLSLSLREAVDKFNI